METGSHSAGGTAPLASSSGYGLAVLGLIALVFGLGLAHVRERHAPQAEAASWVDPASARVCAAPAWADPRWLEHLDLVLERQPCFEVEDPRALESLAQELSALSFVERVERLEASAGAGLRLDLTLRQPVACIPAQGEFALVDEDGVVLEGRWPLPPRLGRVFLPVLGPLDDPLFARARSGDWLVEPEHTDALDVALSLEEHLGEDERAGLGRILIDARAARRASLAEPGVRLELEGARLALFGRAPGTDEPGELAVASKWQGLARARELFERDPASHDWLLVDLRWDRPDLGLRNTPENALVQLEADAPLGRTARSGEHDGSRPRVR